MKMKIYELRKRTKENHIEDEKKSHVLSLKPHACIFFLSATTCMHCLQD